MNYLAQILFFFLGVLVTIAWYRKDLGRIERTTDSNAEIVLRVIQLFDEGKIREALNHYDEKVIVYTPGSVFNAEYRGHGGLTDLAERANNVLPGRPDFQVLSVLEAGEKVVIEIEGTTTNVGSRQMQWRTVEIFELRDLKIVSMRMYTDTEALAKLTAGLSDSVN